MALISEIRSTDSITNVDPIWDSLRHEAQVAADNDPVLATFLYSTVLHHRTLEDSVIYRISERLDHADVPSVLLRQAFNEC